MCFNIGGGSSGRLSFVRRRIEGGRRDRVCNLFAIRKLADRYGARGESVTQLGSGGGPVGGGYIRMSDREG